MGFEIKKQKLKRLKRTDNWVWPWDPRASWDPRDTVNLWSRPIRGAASAVRSASNRVVDGAVSNITGVIKKDLDLGELIPLEVTIAIKAFFEVCDKDACEVAGISFGLDATSFLPLGVRIPALDGGVAPAIVPRAVGFGAKVSALALCATRAFCFYPSANAGGGGLIGFGTNVDFQCGGLYGVGVCNSAELQGFSLSADGSGGVYLPTPKTGAVGIGGGFYGGGTSFSNDGTVVEAGVQVGFGIPGAGIVGLARGNWVPLVKCCKL